QDPHQGKAGKQGNRPALNYRNVRWQERPSFTSEELRRMELTFLGGASEVGASCTLMHIVGHRLLIDGGMRPAAREGQSRLPDLTLLETAPPEALLITHAHIISSRSHRAVSSCWSHPGSCDAVF